MAQIADITVFDGASTPVSHSLKAIAVNTENGVVKALWRESIATLPLEAQISVSLTYRKLPSGVMQIDGVVSVPVMESISGQNAAGYTAAPKVAYVDTLKVSGFAHPRSTVASQRLARQILVNLLSNVSTSVAAATTGPFPDAFDSKILPS